MHKILMLAGAMLLAVPVAAAPEQQFLVRGVSGDTLALANPLTGATASVSVPAGRGKEFMPGQRVFSDGSSVIVPVSPHELLRQKMGKKK